MKNNEKGSISPILLVLVVCSVVFVIYQANERRLQAKLDEIKARIAVSNAKQVNIAAISYLHGSLEDGIASPAIFKVINNKIVGSGNSEIRADSNGIAYCNQPNLASINPSFANQIFVHGNGPIGGSSPSQTRLEILETIGLPGHTKTFVVKATTMANYQKNYYPVESIGRIDVTDLSALRSGMMQATDCVTCVAQAKILTLTIGYVADITKTINFGFYKIAASTNLCDVHFMNNMGDRIEDHDGTTSVLKTQVAVYCPCTCGWAR